MMLFLYRINVFGYNRKSIVMLVSFYYYLSFAVIFFFIYSFVTAKAALPKIALKKPPGLASETSNQQLNSSVVQRGYE